MSDYDDWWWHEEIYVTYKNSANTDIKCLPSFHDYYQPSYTLTYTMYLVQINQVYGHTTRANNPDNSINHYSQVLSNLVSFMFPFFFNYTGKKFFLIWPYKKNFHIWLYMITRDHIWPYMAWFDHIKLCILHDTIIYGLIWLYMVISDHIDPIWWHI